jgi:pimeloyl-ACP methyl ester carboxylesterase
MSSRISLSPTYDDPSASHHLIFFITGNPGLISYYDTFLGYLHQLLSEQSNLSKSNVFHIYGESLAGFGDTDTPSKTTGHPYTLEDQIQTRLQCLKDQRIPSGSRQGQQYDSIILMGHSVGTYILLEVLQRLRKSASTLNVTAGILLMPTVIGLAESASGVKAKPLFRIPSFPRGASQVANALLWPIPKSGVKWLVGLLLGMPDASAEVTARFLKSNMGIWQAL